jgi:hypothetical protein
MFTFFVFDNAMESAQSGSFHQCTRLASRCAQRNPDRVYKIAKCRGGSPYGTVCFETSDFSERFISDGRQVSTKTLVKLSRNNPLTDDD